MVPVASFFLVFLHLIFEHVLFVLFVDILLIWGTLEPVNAGLTQVKKNFRKSPFLKRIVTSVISGSLSASF